MKKTFPSILAFTIFTIPLVVSAQLGIPCGSDTPPADHPCGFNDLLILVNNIIDFIIYYIAVPLAALGFMAVGARLVLMPNKEGEWTHAKGVFWDIGMGFGIILGAYVLIKMVLFAFLSEEQINFMRFILDLT